MGSKWTLGRLAGEVWSIFTWLRIGTVGCRECNNEPSGSGATELVIMYVCMATAESRVLFFSFFLTDKSFVLNFTIFVAELQ
jgi:hypothetical protein